MNNLALRTTLLLATVMSLVATQLFAGKSAIESMETAFVDGGLFRSIEWSGAAAHELSFHLCAGDVLLYEGEKGD